MWKCKKCGEENVGSHHSCWSCGLSQDGTAMTNAKEFQSMKEEAAESETLTGYTSTYGTSRMIAEAVSFIGWIVVGIGILVVLVLFAKSSESHGGFTLMSLLPALLGIISGLLLVMTGQLTRAMVDTADNTGQMLSLLKRRRGK
ncbi:MAG: hypothetical protein KKH04_10280 [Proteobacteria bacterium]|nr:hypothetical protein [Pseudomonadota bacterium]